MEERFSKYLFRTNYFNRVWTWIRRIAALIILNFVILVFQIDSDISYLKYIFIVVITLYILLKPKDDLAIDYKYLYHIKKSLFKPFTRIDKYKISELYSIKCGGIHDDTFELVDLFNGGGSTGGYSNTVEMIFKDDTSKSLELRISRKNLDKMILLVNELRKERNRA